MQGRICALVTVVMAIGTVVWLSNAREPQAIAAPPKPVKVRQADVPNDACLQCHQNLAKEPLSSNHEKHEVSCAKCHGASHEHMAEAKTGVKADILFGRAEVDRLCKQCHKGKIHKEPAKIDEFITEWQGKRRPNNRRITADSICADCHGVHVLDRPATQPAGTALGVALFNGRDLSGWQTVGNARWSVEDGTLVGTQGPDGAPGDLLSETDYRDFDLNVVYKVDWPANSGIWFRYQNPETSYQADILEYKNPEAYSGTIYCPGKLFIARNLDPQLENKTGFNTMRIRVQGDHLQVWLNGRQVGDVRDNTIASGKIGFQVHAGDEFKNMRLTIRQVTITELN